MHTESDYHRKPKASSHQLVQKLKQDLGVSFHYCDEETAEAYMLESNNFLRVASYRKNFAKDQSGHYIGLDFGCLRELADLDRELRTTLLGLCLDTEHYLKVKLLADIEEDPTTDGYDIVREFLSRNRAAITQMEMNASGAFTADLLEKYFTVSGHRGEENRPILDFNDCPAWVLVEVLNLNHLVKFYTYYYESRGRDHLSEEVLGYVRGLRNACAHNNCLLANLEQEERHVPDEITAWLGESSRLLTARPLLEMACLLYAYRYVGRKTMVKVQKDGRYVKVAMTDKEAVRRLCSLLKDRFPIHADWFADQTLLQDAYHLAIRMINRL